ncbi:reverse transcriptase domain-containing protein [Tanacetum coccineum]
MLKKCTKKSDFLWTEEAESAFKQIKELIAKLPMLIAPKEKEELIIYLATYKEAVSAVLMTEREAKQMPIYFVSLALRGPKVNYTSMEKLVLALVQASKRLRRYFQAHPIIVVTDQPIKNILSNPEVAGRMQKWSIQLGEFGIHYRPRIFVKWQVLADFIMERPEEDPDGSIKTADALNFTRWQLSNSSCRASTLYIESHLAEDGWQNLTFKYNIDNVDVDKFVFESKWLAVNERWFAFREEPQ